jgi:predicted permease
MSLVIIVFGLSLQLVSFTFTRVLTDIPMPFPNGERYIIFKQLEPTIGMDAFFPFYDEYEYQRIREQSNSYDVLGAMFDQDMVISDGEFSQNVDAVRIEPQLLEATAVRPLMGRLFSAEDLAKADNKVALISEGLWASYYANAPDIIGRVAHIEGVDHIIVGVMPKRFRYPSTDQLWLPFDVNQAASPDNAQPLAIIGVLKDGTTLVEATAELDFILKKLVADYPDRDTLTLPKVDNFAAQRIPSNMNLQRNLLFLTWLIIGLAALNLGTLLFVRTLGRRQEMAVRTSVGASVWQSMKQVLMESFILCAFGFLISLCVSQVILTLVNTLIIDRTANSPFWYDFSLSAKAIALGAFAMIVIWLAASVGVAYRVARKNPAEILGAGEKGATTEGNTSWITRSVVGMEVTLSCFLLVLSLVVVTVIVDFFRADVGTPVKDYYAASVKLTGERYTGQASRVNFLSQLRQRIETIPEVAGISFATLLPSEGLAWQGQFKFMDRELENYTRQLSIWVDGDYFSTMKVNLIEGRYFDSLDTETSNPVVIVRQKFASTYWPNESAVGKIIKLSYEGEAEKQFRIVGVIDDINQTSLMNNMISPFYRPLTQDPPDTFQLAIKTSPNANPAALETGLKDALSGIDRNIALGNFSTLGERVQGSLMGVGNLATPFIVIALVTLGFACIGIYGVIARSIVVRTHIIGIQRALGSSNYKIIGQFIKQGGWYFLIGIVFGCGSAVALTSLTAPIMSVIKPNILTSVAITVLFVSMVMAVLIFFSSYFPARKAVSMEPGDALRYE